MKKFFAFALALVLTFALSVTCFAAIAADGTGSESKSVTAKYVAPTYSGEVYGVNVEFGKMEFTYTAASQGTWDPDTHTYLESAAAKWTADGNTVKVTNHSNVAITVKVAYANAQGVEGVTGSFDKPTFDLDAGVAGDKANADNDTATLTLAGAIDQAYDVIGTVTVTIAKKTA